MNNSAPVLELFTKRAKAAEEETEIPNDVTQEEQDEVTEILEAFFKRQGKSILPKLLAGTDWWNADRWNKELADDLEPVFDKIAEKHGNLISDALGMKFIKELIVNYLRDVAEKRAELINDETYQKLTEATEGSEDLAESVGDAMEKRIGIDAALLGSMLAKKVAGWGTQEACRQAKNGGSTKQVFKVWVTGPNARKSHSGMNGERVPIDDKFSNGADWPGDDSLTPDESCGCNCTTKVIIIS